MRILTATVLTLSIWLSQAQADPIQTQAGAMTATPVITGLDTPWAFGFLPDGTILVTERGGRLLAWRDGAVTEIANPPPVVVDGQGGLLDILVPRDFAQSRELFFTYAKKQLWREGTAVYRARLSADGTRLEGGKAIFEMTRGSGGGFHFGSRLAEARDGTLLVTIGDRGEDASAQDLGRHNGSVLRITRDGKAPSDNPFVGQGGAEPEIWSYGHRNPQGMAMDPAGQLWAVEHGARGGDEVNRIEPGRNYGWPVISYGTHYSGAKIGEGTAKEGLQQPVFYWDPSIAPSGMTFYDGAIADWRGNAFIGSLKFDYISRLSGDPLREVERIEGPETERVRDVRQGPDGALWFLSEGNGALYRLAP
ncbi:PQQ-dependent sugar dehydrogenase [Thalassococcus sp. CAU 1522]|uniref:PQQ-dependent sugar dehydrogenase n=1 Tax=Thalassococcus arenae TaxID=2851652 RepID=A0ABS6NAY5_9RHOB|nr:PQQ-dependent sugar dehydrogenase [Thalassococcus arenae]MBV2360958.1 PQQ-dependent sugar dehydrogenase [Thalassococcus arenae]